MTRLTYIPGQVTGDRVTTLKLEPRTMSTGVTRPSNRETSINEREYQGNRVTLGHPRVSEALCWGNIG